MVIQSVNIAFSLTQQKQLKTQDKGREREIKNAPSIHMNTEHKFKVLETGLTTPTIWTWPY